MNAMQAKPLAALLALTLCSCAHIRGGSAALPPNIRPTGSPEFRGKAAQALLRIERTSAGRELLGEIQATRKTVILRYGHQDAGGIVLPIGEGDSLVLWDPKYDLPDFPSFLALHHELIHALYVAESGTLDESDEESRAVGFGQFAPSKISENALRRELGLPLRTDHGSVDDWLKTHKSQQ